MSKTKISVFFLIFIFHFSGCISSEETYYTVEINGPPWEGYITVDGVRENVEGTEDTNLTVYGKNVYARISHADTSRGSLCVVLWLGDPVDNEDPDWWYADNKLDLDCSSDWSTDPVIVEVEDEDSLFLDIMIYSFILLFLYVYFKLL